MGNFLSHRHNNDKLQNIPSLIDTLKKLNTSLANDKLVLGLEYLAFIHNRSVNQFECMLCPKNKVGTLQNMMNHFKSKGHYLMYLDRHFPIAHHRMGIMTRACELSDDDFDKLLKRVARLINNKSEKEYPIALSYEDILAKKESISSAIFKSSKRNETTQKFLIAYILDEVTRFQDNFNLKSIRVHPQYNLDDDKKPKGSVENDSSNKTDRNSESKSKSFDRNEEELEARQNVKASIPSSELVKIYRDSYEKRSKKICEQYKIYRKLLHKHPDYDTEWISYCLKKFKENPKIDYTSDFFKERWKYLWKAKLLKLEKEDLLRERVELRTQMHLPIDPSDIDKLNEIEMKKAKERQEIGNYEPTRKRKAPIKTSESDEQIETQRKRNCKSPQYSCDIFEIISSAESIPETVSTISYETIDITEDDEILQNDKFDCVQDIDNSGDVRNEFSQESIHQYFMTITELLLLYDNFQVLPKRTKDLFCAYMDMLKKLDIETYHSIINKRITVNETNPCENEEPSLSDSDYEENCDDKLLKNAFGNVSVITSSTVPEIIEQVDLT